MIRPATAYDAMELADTMREEDKAEAKALTGLEPLPVLAMGLLHSQFCISGIGKRGGVSLMGGVVPTANPVVGSVWMLSAPDIVENRREILAEGRKWLDHAQQKFPILTNVVSENNEAHLRLLKHLGFRFFDPIDNYGVDQIRVIPFERTAYV